MLIGSGHSADTLRLKAFLVRNGHPHVYLDVERDASVDALLAAHWPLKRRPYQFETSLPRVFAVGDVRSGSMKRVASAVGEGSAAIQLVPKVS